MEMRLRNEVEAHFTCRVSQPNYTYMYSRFVLYNNDERTSAPAFALPCSVRFDATHNNPIPNTSTGDNAKTRARAIERRLDRCPLRSVVYVRFTSRKGPRSLSRLSTSLYDSLNWRLIVLDESEREKGSAGVRESFELIIEDENEVTWYFACTKQEHTLRYFRYKLFTLFLTPSYQSSSGVNFCSTFKKNPARSVIGSKIVSSVSVIKIPFCSSGKTCSNNKCCR